LLYAIVPPEAAVRLLSLSMLLVGGCVGAMAATGEAVRIALPSTSLLGTAVFVLGCAVVARRRQRQRAAAAQGRRQAALGNAFLEPEFFHGERIQRVSQHREWKRLHETELRLGRRH